MFSTRQLNLRASFRRLGALLAACSIAVILAWGLVGVLDLKPDNSSRAHNSRSMALWPPPPSSMTELVEESDVIVSGRIESVIREFEMGPYADNSIHPVEEGPVPADPNPTATPTLPGVHVTLYEVSIDRILLADGRIQDSGTIEYIEAGSAEENIAFADSKPMPQPGDEFLFAFVLSPDGANYAAGRWGLIDISGGEVVYADWERAEVSYAAEMSPAEFIANIEEEAELKGRDIR